jgi:hypothetical protein
MPSPNASLYQMFKLNQNAFPGVNPGAFSAEANDEASATDMSNESQRERALLNESNTRAEAGIRQDLVEADQVRGARNMGFEGSHPLREQADYTANQKLRQVLLPEQIKLEAALAEQRNNETFTSQQHELDRQSREKMAAGAQAGQMNRVNAQQSAITARQPDKRGWLMKMLGIGAPPAAAQSAPAAQDGGSGMVMMEAPTGEQQMVPAARVQEFLAKGAQLVQ